MEKENIMKEWLGNISREMETKKNKKEMLEIHNVTEIQNAFDGHISR